MAVSAPAPAFAQENPIQEFFKEIDRALRGIPTEKKDEEPERDRRDLRPVQRTEENRRLQQAKRLIERSQWEEAVEVLQHLLDQPEDGFLTGQGREFRSFQSEAETLLGSLPDEARRRYESRYGAIADRLLSQAIEEQNEELFRNLSARYLWTPAGASALRMLIRLRRDAGELEGAARLSLRLADAVEEPNRSRYRGEAALMLAMAGREQAAQNAAKLLTVDQSEWASRLSNAPRATPLGGESSGVVTSLHGDKGGSLEPAPSRAYDWGVELLERYALKKGLSQVRSNLVKQGQMIMAVALPLVVGDRVFVRTLRGLQARDVRTGEILWEQRPVISPESLLSASLLFPSSFAEWGYHSFGDEELHHSQLTNLFYRDEVFSSLSSDGRQLYAIDSGEGGAKATPSNPWRRYESDNRGPVPWEYNELSAYDLATGRVRWTVGGEKIEDPFNHPLAGTYFFGAPLPVNEGLLVVGEREGEVSLFCLSPQTGEPLWMQPLAAATTSVAMDVVRRWWTSIPAVSDGVVVCETTCGWVVALDRETRRLLWTTRLSPRGSSRDPYFNRYSIQPILGPNERWIFSSPIIVQDRVILTPRELPDEMGATQPFICCLDLKTGRKLWERPKNEGLYLAGIWNSLAVIVSKDSVKAIRIDQNGDLAWSTSLKELAIGRGAIVDDQLVLPLLGSKLVQINLQDGSVAKSESSTFSGLLGNLTFAKGGLISHSGHSIYMYPQGSGADENEEMQATRLLAEAGQFLAIPDAERALEQLDELRALIARGTADWSTEWLDDVKEEEWKCLEILLQKDPANRPDLLARMEGMVDRPERRRIWQRFETEARAAQRDLSAAAGYLRLVMEAPLDERVKEGAWTWRIDSWVARRLQALSDSLSPTDQSQCNELMTRTIAEAPSEAAIRARLARSLSFHPLGRRLEHQLATEALRNGNVSEAVIRFQRASRSPEPALQAKSLLELAELFVKQGAIQDAQDCWTKVLALPDLPTTQGQSHALAVQQRSGNAAPIVSAANQNWGSAWSVMRTNGLSEEDGLISVMPQGAGVRPLQAIRYLNDPEQRRLRLERQGSGEFIASLPLREMSALSHSPGVGVQLAGPYSLVVHRGVVHCLSWPDKTIRWTWRPEDRAITQSYWNFRSGSPRFEFRPLTTFLREQRLTGASNGGAELLLAVNEQALLVFSEGWIALDPITGEELWRVRDGSLDANLVRWNDDQFLNLASRPPQLVSAWDGSEQPIPEALLSLSTLIALDQNDVIGFEEVKPPLEQTSYWLKRVRPAGEIVWSLPLSRRDRLARADEFTLLWIDEKRNFKVLDLRTGESSPVKGLPAAFEKQLTSNKPMAVAADSERIYLFAERGDWESSHLNLHSIRVGGLVAAIDRSGAVQWDADLTMLPSVEPGADDQSPPKVKKRRWPLNALLHEMEASPLLLFAGDRADRQGEFHLRRCRLVGLDKTTGQIVLDWERPMESGSFDYFHVHLESKFIELRTYNEKLILRATQPSSAQAGLTP